MQIQELLLTEREAARVLKCSIETLRQRRRGGRGPAFVRLGPKLIRYQQDAIDEFIQQHTSQPRPEAGSCDGAATAA